MEAQDAWKKQNSNDWDVHRGTQQVIETKDRCNGYQLGDYYEQVVQFVYSVALHEGFQLDHDSNIWQATEKESNLLENFLAWFWKKFGLYINMWDWTWCPGVWCMVSIVLPNLIKNY